MKTLLTMALGSFLLAVVIAVMAVLMVSGWGRLPIDRADWTMLAVGLGASVWALLLVGCLLTARVCEAVSTYADRLGASEPSALPRTPIWMRSLMRALSRVQQTVQQRESTWRTRVRDLEIRERIADADRARAESVLGVMREAVIVTNAFDEIVYANEAAGHLLKFDAGDSARRALGDVVADTGLCRLISETREASCGLRQIDHVIEGGDEPVCCVAMLSTLKDSTDEVSSVVTVLHDMTREREIAQLKSEFVSKASHELRTPLSSVQAYVEMLVDGEADDEASRQEFYGIIQAETERLSRLVDNMLNISRIEAGIVRVDRDAVDFEGLIDRAVQTLEPQAREKRISIHRELAPVDLHAVGDVDMLYQVVVNLVSNAIKYTPEGGRVTISADSDHLERCVHVSVADTGLGVPPDDVDRIFEKFYRIENYKRVAKGTGLGLNLCRQIIETLHGGQIGLESRLGLGSRFWFTVPMSLESEREPEAKAVAA
ncbi:MAG: cell wall metabolism sensor histidine kinase WalK [Phycisphaerales bacterium]|nr:cell wall metabolism sensor histidine kinase WalK [Phycisphaerales bacterium]